MEVHAHSHTPRKKWSHYFWEFFMLFLAVFCGFLAEYQLEHKIERDREKQYMKSLLSNLKADTMQLNQRMRFRKDKIAYFDTLMMLLKSPDLNKKTAAIYLNGFWAPIGARFLPNDGVLAQLKNAGGLRLIHKQVVVDSLLNYDTETKYMVDFENWERDRFIDVSAYEKVLDASVFEQNLQYKYPQEIFIFRTPAGNPPLLSYKKEDLDQFYNRIQLQKRLNAVIMNGFFKLQAKAGSLISLIEKEYHLE